MISKFIIIGFLSYLCSETRAQYSLKYFEKSSVESQCVFDFYQKNYNVTDLLRCIYELAANLFVQNDGRSSKQTNNLDSLESYDGESYENIISNVLKITSLYNNASSTYRNFPLTDNYPSNYPKAPNESFGDFDGLGVNIFNALLSIYRYDDLKCVPRILCEVASGNPPGGYRMASTGGNWQELGTNLLKHWIAITIFDTPIVTFIRAALMGYNNGNPSTCYREFPRCPRNPDKLVHYLNNHNGGFFRFFSQGAHGSYPQLSYASRGNSEILGERKLKAPPPGIARAEADRTGTGELKFDVPISTAHQEHGRSFFPEENTLKSSGQVVFPDHDGSDDHPSENRISKSLSDCKSLTGLQRKCTSTRLSAVFP
ncbi:uncharacterized protein [Linepithema humile]|uniref:uncharacterized protein n=1 Tax=Linepithema humile TaxID=83485 RepID=UPI000623147D|nr:PREDICTED: uncharacterized protein LOC105672141 [Linepithema humile]